MAEHKATDLTLEEKAALTSGADFWTTEAIERAGVPSVMVTDGPYGLRKQAGAYSQCHCVVWIHRWLPHATQLRS